MFLHTTVLFFSHSLIVRNHFFLSNNLNIEKRLVEKAIQHDRIAQKTIFENYYIQMFNTAFRIVKKEELALDVVQEAFIKVFKYIHTFEFRSTLFSWMKKILINEALRLLKDDLKFESNINETFEEVIEWQDSLTGEYLLNAILKLPDGYRAVFILIEIEGYNHREVAEMLNISVGTSKSQLFYAKKTLQKHLSDLKE